MPTNPHDWTEADRLEQAAALARPLGYDDSEFQDPALIASRDTISSATLADNADDKPAMLLAAAAAEQKLALIAAHRGVTDPDWPATPYQARQFAADIRAILQREAF